MCTATCQSPGCTVKLFIHTRAFFWREALQCKHSNALQHISVFAKHMSSPLSVFGLDMQWITLRLQGGLLGLHTSREESVLCIFSFRHILHVVCMHSPSMSQEVCENIVSTGNILHTCMHTKACRDLFWELFMKFSQIIENARHHIFQWLCSRDTKTLSNKVPTLFVFY